MPFATFKERMKVKTSMNFMLLILVYCSLDEIEMRVDPREDFRLAHHFAWLVPVADDPDEFLLPLPVNHQRLTRIAWTRRCPDAAATNDSIREFRDAPREKVLTISERNDFVAGPVRRHCCWSRCNGQFFIKFSFPKMFSQSPSLPYPATIPCNPTKFLPASMLRGNATISKAVETVSRAAISILTLSAMCAVSNVSSYCY